MRRFSDPSKPLAFYVSAHQDDWIYFRGEQASADLRDANVVLILTTAGDAGLTDGWWQARDQGLTAALLAAAPASEVATDWVTVDGTGPHLVCTSRFDSGAVYFLRLPDVTLNELRKGRADGVETVDGLTAYAGWADFCATLRNIVALECRAADARHPWVNAHHYRSDPGDSGDPNSPGVNPDDHSDHYCTGLAVRSFAAGFCQRAWWWGYSVQKRDAFRIGDPAALAGKRALFDAYSGALRSRFRQVGEPRAWKRWVDDLKGEWDQWGEFGHADAVPFGHPDPEP